MYKKVLASAGKRSATVVAGLVLAIGSTGTPLLTARARADVPVHDISTCAELQAMDDDASTVADTFRLTANIDCSNAVFTPLEWNGGPFGGAFDGQGYHITGFNAVAESSAFAGLFSYTLGATIQNFTISGTSHSVDGYAGAVTGQADDTNISNVIAHVDVTSDNSDAGGLVGDVDAYDVDVDISHCAATGNVSGADYVGGLIAYAYSDDGQIVSVHESYATGTVSGHDKVGGLIGEAEAGTSADNTFVYIANAYATGNVTASGVNAGGLVGSVRSYSDDGGAADITIQNTYATGTVAGDDNIGSLVGAYGYNEADGTLNLYDSFAASPLSLNSEPYYAGAILGYLDGETDPIGLYFDADRVGSPEDACAPGSTLWDCNAVNLDGTDADYFFNSTTHPPLDEWDFEGNWMTHTNTYPTLVPFDQDGISASVEDAAPNSGDANNDGTPDSQQANVASFVNPQTSKYVSLEVSAACSISVVDAINANNNTVKDSAYTYPLGMLDFSVDCGVPGFTATITQYYYGAPSNMYVVRKYSPATHAYTTVSGATFSTVTIAGQSVVKATYDITDGDALDLDGTANGTIVDPAGLGVLAAGVPSTGFRRG